MDDSVAVEVLEGISDLLADLFGSVFRDFEAALVHVVEEILAFHVFEDYEVVVGVLE